ncbi:MAG: YdeI/OmpD-associated family protein [Pseudomonadota bacterium]
MATLDPRIDEYIANSAEFAQPILTHLRQVIHAACPEVEETMKWSMPHFMYKGILCNIAGFKAHCAMGFWHGSLLFPDVDKSAMGHLGKITSIKDLPSKKELAGYVRKAVQMADEGVKVEAKPKAAPKPLVVPDYFAATLKADKAALTVFEAGSPSFKREYVMWLEDAKTEVTRNKRMAQAIEWLAEGKARNWKYEKC